MERSTKFKKISLAVLSLAAMTLVAGCDKIEAKPSADVYNAALLNTDSAVTYNAMSRIYDALITEGDTNSAKVLSNILYIYSQSIYGNFFETTTLSNGVVLPSLKGAVEKHLAGDDADCTTIAKALSVYQDESGNPIVQKVVNFYADILARIRSTFLGYVTGTTYQVRSEFYEKKFYDAQVNANYDLATVSNGVYPYNEGAKVVDGTFRLSETIVETGPKDKNGDILVLDGQMVGAGDATHAYFKNIFGTYQDYIAKSILPDIYRNELTSQYLYSKNLGQIKITAERKVDCVTLAENAQYPGKVSALLNAYAKNVLTNTAYYGKWDEFGFTFLNNLYKGTTFTFNADQVSMANTIYGEANWNKLTLSAPISIGDWTINNYYAESSLGTSIAQYLKFTNDRSTDDTAERATFTSSGTYTIKTALAIKVKTLYATDNTVHGWFTSSQLDKLSSSSLKTRLFKTTVANEVDSTAWTAGAGYASCDYKVHTTGTSSSDYMKYGYYRGGNYYLLPETYEKEADYPYLVKDGDNWYIVKVDEAVKSAKVNPSSTATSGSSVYYDKMAKHAGTADYFGETVSRTTAYSLSSSDTWKNAANKYYVEEMALIYHDTYVYNYFKTTFPAIFED